MPQKITSFNKQNLRNGSELDQALEAALNQVAEKFGLKARLGGGKFTDNEFTGKIILTVADPEAAAMHEKNEFNAYCNVFRLKPEHYGTTLRHLSRDGEPCTLIGFVMTRSKFCIKTRTASGKIILFTEQAVKHLQPTTPQFFSPLKAVS